jgi:hypothetical protein
MTTKSLRLFIGGTFVILGLFLVTILWELFLFPTSLNEFLFRHRLKEASNSGAMEIRITDLAPFDWEEVCFHHAYNGDWRYDKYHRVYRAPAKGAQDGIETLLFIKHDGRPTYFVGTAGIEIIHQRRLCWSRNEAVMKRVFASRPRYSMTGDIP